MDVLNLPPSHFFHVFKIKQHYILLDSGSHSIFKVDDRIWNDYLSGTWTPLLKEVYEEGKKENFFELHTPASIQYSMDHRCYKALCLIVTRQCNLKCSYCFEHHQPDTSAQPFMSLQTAKKALLWLIHQSKERKNLEVDFFGGEPLLNFPLIRDTVHFARSLEKKYYKHFQFSLTTNATLLSGEILDFLHEQRVSVIFSLDGSLATNDLFRMDHKGRGTYRKTLKQINGALPYLETGYYVRGTYTHQTLRFCKEFIHLYEEGIRQISFEPVASAVKDIAIEAEDLPKIKNEYEKLAEWIFTQQQKDPNLRFYHFEIDLEQGMCKEKLCSGCGTGVEYLSVSPDGDLYPCHQFDGRKAFCMGNINNFEVNDDLRNQFKENTLLYSREECSNCWAKMLCGGGCIANHQFLQGDVKKVYSIGCEIQKMRLEAALYLKYLKNIKTT